VNFGRESAAPPPSINQEFVQVDFHVIVVQPQSGQRIRNSRIRLKKGHRLDLDRKACYPPCRDGELLVQRLKPSPTARFPRSSQRYPLWRVTRVGIPGIMDQQGQLP
jgi:hypothetical protein